MNNEVINLIKKTSIELPGDIVEALKKASQNEVNKTRAQNIILNIIDNIKLAKKEQKPICQDTGVPIFYVKYPKKYSQIDLKKIIINSLNIATKEIPLRPNSVDSLTGDVCGNIPIIHFEEANKLEIDLIFKGGGSENVSQIYKLPDPKINAKRDLDGVRKCILKAIVDAQGKGCPPYIIGVAIGGNIEQVAHESKKQLLRELDDENRVSELDDFEKKVLGEVNKLKIGPLGLGGATTALGVKISSGLRHPASYFVGVSVGCWSLRRRSVKL